MLSRLTWSAVPIIVVLLVWESVVALAQLPMYFLPAPSIIGFRLWQESFSPAFHAHVLATFTVACTGVVLAVLSGTVIAWLFYRFHMLYVSFNGIFTVTQAIPILAIAPLIYVWIPDAFWARTFVAWLITVFPIYAASYSGLQRIPRELHEVAALDGASRWQSLHSYEAVLALPVLLSGVRISLALATTGAVVGEFLGGRDGIGALINIARGLFDTPLLFVAIFVLIGITTLFTGVFMMIERSVQVRFGA
jgi:NitT/TauT family transport system permease protein